MARGLHMYWCRNVAVLLRVLHMANPTKNHGKPQGKPQAAQAAQAVNPMAQAVAQLTAQAATVANVPAVAVPVPATFAGIPWAQLAKHQQAVATAKAPQQVAPKLAAVTLVLNPAKPYRVQAANNVAWHAAIVAALATGPQTAAQLAQACGYPGFVGYLVRKGWLVPATA